MDMTFFPAPLKGIVAAPASKSEAHRRMICAGLTRGTTTLTGFMDSADMAATARCLKALGSRLTQEGDTLTVEGCVYKPCRLPVLDCGESGSTLRFFVPIALAMAGSGVFRMHGRLGQRPMDVYRDLFVPRGVRWRMGEFEKERGVILEEIAMCEDTPEDLVYDLLAEAYFGEHPLARPILGTHDQIASVSREALIAFRKKHYRPDNTVLAIAGQFDLEQFKEMAERYLGAWQATGDTHEPEAVAGCDAVVKSKKKDIEQVHICLAYPGVGQDDDDLYALTVMNNLFGGGMSSRLFQHIREDMGAAYSVYSYPSTYTNCGTLTIYAGTSPDLAQPVIDALHGEIKKLVDGGVTDEEFAMAKEQLKVSYVLGLESSSSRMSSIGRSKLLRGRAVDPEDVVKKIEAVTKADVERVTQRIFTQPCAASVVGRNIEALKVL